MPRVYVQFAGMKQLGDAWTAVGSQISEIQGSFSKTVQNLDWDIKCQSDISATASRLSGNMENYFQALQGYRTFFQQAYDAYQKLDQNDTSHKVAPGSASGGGAGAVIGIGSLIAGSNYGKRIYDIINGFKNSKNLSDFIKSSRKGFDFAADFIQDFINYSKIGRAVGSKTATSWFLRNAVGLKPVGYISRAKNVVARFANNLTNKTSPFRQQLLNTIDNFTGKNGVKNAIPCWLGVAATGVCSWISNKEEQAASGGTMSDNRVAAETVLETVIDTAASIGVQVAVGSALAALGGPVAATTLVTVAVSNVAVAGVNALTNHFFEKSATECITDFVLDCGEGLAEGVGNAATAVSNAVGGWFNKIFA